MIKINILKNGIVTNSASFKTIEEKDEWLKDCIDKETFGKPEHQRELTPRIHNEDGTVTEATYETVPSEYVIEEIDITQEVEAENLKKQYPPISPRQIRLALLSVGITEVMVDSAIATLPSPDKEAAMIAWKYSTQFERFIPAVEQIGLMLNFDGVGLNTLWERARLF